MLFIFTMSVTSYVPLIRRKCRIVELYSTHDRQVLTCDVVRDNVIRLNCQLGNAWNSNGKAKT